MQTAQNRRRKCRIFAQLERVLTDWSAFASLASVKSAFNFEDNRKRQRRSLTMNISMKTLFLCGSVLSAAVSAQAAELSIAANSTGKNIAFFRERIAAF